MKKYNGFYRKLLLTVAFLAAPAALFGAQWHNVGGLDVYLSDEEFAYQQQMLERFAQNAERERAAHRANSLSMVEQLLNKNGIDAQRDLAVGITRQLPRDRRCLIRKLSDSVVVAQLPAVSQVGKGAVCGSCAYVNSNYLCQLQDIDDLKAFLPSDLLSQEIDEHTSALAEYRWEQAAELYQSNRALFDASADLIHNYIGLDSMMLFDEMMRSCGMQYSSRVSDVWRTIIVMQDSTEKYLRVVHMRNARERFRLAGDPEVFVVNTGRGHWITIRVERMSNGMLGIILVDSFWTADGVEAVDKIGLYENRLFSLTQLFA